MNSLFICYKSCSTCAKAKRFLENNKVDFQYREIDKEKPTTNELKSWIQASGLPIKSFFNTSGKVYRDLKLKDKLADMSEESKINLLASNGMLVKRPILIIGNKVLVGFKEAEYRRLV